MSIFDECGGVLRLPRTGEEYEEAIVTLEGALQAGEAHAQTRLLALVVEEYEKEHYPIPLPAPVEAIRFRMEQQGLIQADLVPYLGSRARVSEVLSGKRGLSLAMIRKLHKGLGIPLEVLVQDTGEE